MSKPLIYGTAGEMSPMGDELEKMFRNPSEAIHQTFISKMSAWQQEFDQLTFKIQERIARIEEVDNIRPYDMTDDDYYQSLMNTEMLHCGPHSPDSPEGKWIKLYKERKATAAMPPMPGRRGGEFTVKLDSAWVPDWMKP